MGAFFTNVQVHVGSQSSEAVRNRIAEILCAWITSQGFEQGEDDSVEPDRVVLIAPADDTPWISTYDEVTEDQDEQVLRELTQRVSAAANAAVGVLVHDSDVLQLYLCRDGSVIDAFNNQPDYFVGVLPGVPAPSDADREQAAGHSERWAALLGPPATPCDLRAAWDTRPVRVEDMLARVAAVLGWDAARCATGLTNLRQDRPPVDLTPFMRLAFGLQAGPWTQFRGQGPPKLIQVGGQQDLEAAVGQLFEQAIATFQSVGGASRGLYVAVWGPALDAGLVEPPRIQLVRRDERGGIDERKELPLKQGQAGGVGAPLAYAVAEDFVVPRGWTAGPDLVRSPVHGMSRKRARDAAMAAWVTVVISVRAIAPGTGELHVGVSPLDNLHDGQTAWTFTVRVTPS